MFGEFYNNLEEKGLLGDSVLIMYGDHEGIHKYYDTKGRNFFEDNPGVVLLAGGKIIGKTEDEDHLRRAQDIASKIIKGNYFKIK